MFLCREGVRCWKESPKPLDPQVRQSLSLWVVMHRTLATLTRRAESDIRERGFSLTEWGVLEYLYHKGRQPLANISRKVLITTGSVTYVIDNLERRGLVERQRCEYDRRIIYAVLTEQGRAIMQAEFPRHAEAVHDMMKPLTSTEKETVKALLKKLGLENAVTDA